MPLHPVAAQMVASSKASGRPNAHLNPVPVARANFESDFGGLAKPPVASVKDVTIKTRAGEIPGRLYRNSEASALPLVVWLHGGGWVLGSVDTADVVCRRLCLSSGCAVLSVGYRLSPEAKFPAAVEDAVDAIKWAHANAAELDVDPARLAMAGDSAGGNLAAAACIALRDVGDEDGPKVSLQLLVYPVSTCDVDKGFHMEYDGIILFRDEMLWHQANYLRTPADATDPLVAVATADLRGLPPAVVVLAECDPVRPQGVMLAEALRDAGVPVDVFEAPTLPHGFFGLEELFPEAEGAMTFAGKRLAEVLGLIDWE
ncbi:alpha/beta hydrolase fold-3 [Hyaloraphidium curvatum]|nr:alpha/beta hydrolase fold-3 [Hyaloraphidium curvatum]